MVTQACDRCHRRKTRCDRRLPRCSACERANTPCVHTNKLNLLPYPRTYINSLEISKEQLENEVKELRESLASKSPRSVQSEGGHRLSEATQVSDQVGNEDSGNEKTGPKVISSEVGHPTLKTTGEKRYSGSSSGVTLAGIVYSLVDSSRVPTPRNDEASHGESPVAAQSTRRILPGRSEAMASIEAYFNHWHLTFPLVCRHQFIEIVDRIYADEQYYGKDAFDTFLFNMVLGMGSVNFNKPDWSANSSEFHYNCAAAKLEKVLSMNGLAPLQAILLVCQYSIFCSLRDTSAKMWHLIGIAARLCIEMGLHRKSRADETAAQGTSSGQVRLDIEMRKRTFWCFYNLDRIISVTLGRPVALSDEDIDVPLPTAFNIDQLPLQELVKGTRISSLQYTSPFLHLIAIRKIAGKILKRVHCASTPDNASTEEKLAVQRKFKTELDVWRAEIANVKMSVSEPDNVPLSSFRSKIWYEVPYHNALLLLYRPSAMFPPAPSPSPSHAAPETPVTGLNEILSPAVSVIHLYAELHRTRRLNYSWITLHAMFIAGLSYVYSISRIIKESTSRCQTLPICLEYTRVIGVTRTCSNVLVAINERWGAARESCEIFDRLSTAIIQDSVRAQIEVNQLGNTSNRRMQNFGGQNIVQPGGDSSQPEQQSNIENENNLTYHQDMSSSTSDALCDPTFSLFFPDYSLMSTAETGFRQFSQDLHNRISNEFSDVGTIPSEVAIGFSQDWFADDIGMQEPLGNIFTNTTMESFL